MNNIREKAVIYGGGQSTLDFLKYSSFFSDTIEICAITDKDEKKWGSNLCGYKILPPQEVYKMKYDFFVIPSAIYFEEISDRIMKDVQISRSQIEDVTCIAKRKLSARYKRHQDKADILGFIQTHPISVFNYPFREKYVNFSVEIGFDDENKLYYVMHMGKYKMYMARRLDTEEKVYEYYKSLCLEQDDQSPHRYVTEDFDVPIGDILVDVGTAEGMFSIDKIEKVKRLYIIEMDAEWIEALKYTFGDYMDKVIIVEKFVADYTGYNFVMLDDVIDEDVNFIKMDIEGNEYAAMIGAKNIIKKSKKLKCVLCTYHNDNDEVALKYLAESYGLSAEFSEGYMYFANNVEQLYIMPSLRRGVLRCKKNNMLQIDTVYT